MVMLTLYTDNHKLINFIELFKLNINVNVNVNINLILWRTLRRSPDKARSLYSVYIWI